SEVRHAEGRSGRGGVAGRARLVAGDAQTGAGAQTAQGPGGDVGGHDEVRRQGVEGDGDVQDGAGRLLAGGDDAVRAVRDEVHGQEPGVVPPGEEEVRQRVGGQHVHRPGDDGGDV